MDESHFIRRNFVKKNLVWYPVLSRSFCRGYQRSWHQQPMQYHLVSETIESTCSAQDYLTCSGWMRKMMIIIKFHVTPKMFTYSNCSRIGSTPLTWTGHFYIKPLLFGRYKIHFFSETYLLVSESNARY